MVASPIIFAFRFVENSDLNDESAFTSASQPVAGDRDDEEESDNKQLKSRKVMCPAT